jgi:hypothetical protein
MVHSRARAFIVEAPTMNRPKCPLEIVLGRPARERRTLEVDASANTDLFDSLVTEPRIGEHEMSVGSCMRWRVTPRRGVRRRVTACGTVLTVLAFLGTDVRADADAPGVRLTGAELLLGVAGPENAETAFTIGGRLAVGSLSRSVRLGAGITHWSADIERGGLGAAVKGSISDLAFDVDLRLMPARVKMVRPYVLTALALHLVGADIGDDRSLEDALSGTNIGVDLGIGAESAARGLGWRTEFRQRFVSDVESWHLVAGVRYAFGSDD